MWLADNKQRDDKMARSSEGMGAQRNAIRNLLWSRREKSGPPSRLVSKKNTNLMDAMSLDK